jgi:hypothetical protein
VTQWRKSQQHYAFLLAEFQKLCFRQIRMSFDLNHSRLNSRRFIDGYQLVQTYVRQSDGPALTMVHQILHRPPGVEQSYALVVKDIAVLIPRTLLVAWLECKRSVNQVEIQIVKPESVQTGLKSRSTRSCR